MNLWLARDGNGDLCLYCNEPTWYESISGWDAIDWLDLNGSLFPQIKPGECRRVRLEVEE